MAAEGAGRLSSRGEAVQVLRYWLAALRHEEALAARPKARRPDLRAPSPNLLEPGPGQAYFRFGREYSDFALRAESRARLAVDDGLLRFLERLLREVYRRELSEARGQSEDKKPNTFVAGWPVLHFLRREELATLFRFPVDLSWRRAGGAWNPPSPRERRRGESFAPPDTLDLEARPTDPDSGELPLSVDFGLLHRVLGVSEEDLAELTRRWRRQPPSAEAVVRDVLAMLSSVEEVPPLPASELFMRVAAAVRARLPAGVESYATGIVQDGSLLFATYHLQRELAALLDTPDDAPPLVQDTALWSYLTGQPTKQGSAPLLGRFRARPLTQSQREAAEAALGSTLKAVQGPPGTGKTEVILDLAAHTFVERARRYAAHKTMGSSLLVVTSTNNRAVDNVIAPLSDELPPDRLPLALRAGSQEVTGSATVATIDRALDWLRAQPAEGASRALDQAVERFRAHEAALLAKLAPRQHHEAAVEALRKAEAMLSALPPGPDSELDLETLKNLAAFEAAIVRLHDLLESSHKKLKRRMKRAYEFEVAPILSSVGLPDVALAVESELLPTLSSGSNDEETRRAWEAALARLESRLDEVLGPLRGAAGLVQRKELEATLPALRQRAESFTGDDVEREAHALFDAAIFLRERWAVARRETLLPVLVSVRDALMEQRSLRRTLAAGREVERSLLALFPVIGSTLLSLGNVFDDEPESIERLVIDEAGQCHPAFAVSGLIRARQALLIGDVHQLPPIIQLGESDEARVRREARVRIPEARLRPFILHDRSETSAQALADRVEDEPPRLSDHFRCQPEIIALSDRLSGYALEVHTPRRALTDRAPILSAPVMFFDVPGRQAPARGSWHNAEELTALMTVLEELFAHGLGFAELAVITPYVGQLERLRIELLRRRIPLEASAEEHALFEPNSQGLAVGTVHRFQGGERPVVLFSTVLTESRSLPFLDQRPQLLNVAISRAKDHLLIFGHAPTLASGRRTRVLIEGAAYSKR